MTTQAPPIEREPLSRRAAQRDPLLRLKQETAAEHAAIESAAGIMQDALGPEEYRSYLGRTYGFYQPVEQLLASAHVWRALELASKPRQKLSWLAQDLQALGCDPESLPLCPNPPQLAGLPEAVGCAYVLEGSTLGGRVIARHVQARLGPGAPRAFLEVYGSQTGERWQEFRAALRRFMDCREHESRVIAGAKRTFESFTRWLAE